MEGGIRLAKFRVLEPRINNKKFCHGECQKELPLNDFPKKPARFCKKCTSANNLKKYHERKCF